MATNAGDVGWGAAAAVNPWAIGAKIGLDVLGNLTGNDDERELNERAIALRERAYGDRAPLRAMALSRLEANRPQRPSLTNDFADPSNPFYRAPEPLSFGGGYATPGNSRGEAGLRKQGLESLVTPPGPTMEQVRGKVPSAFRDEFDQQFSDDPLAKVPSAFRDDIAKKMKAKGR